MCKVLMGEAIPKLASEDKILEQAMKASVTKEVRSKYSADPVPPKMPTTKRPLVAPTKEVPTVEEPPSP